MAEVAAASVNVQISRMPPERPPPITDAEYRVVHGAWPRWALHLSLIKLIAWGAAVVGVTILITIVLLALFGAFD